MKKMLIVVNNHFDLAWRRPFNKKLVDGDRVFVSYADLQEMYILKNLELAQKFEDYKFEVESVAVMRHFLKEHPEKEAQIKALAGVGRLYVPGTGDNIVDANLIHGEVLVRNFVRGMHWTEKTLGYMPKLAIRTDAFGNSAQLPQILRGCGLKWVTGLSYVVPNGRYWRGLDGSTVYCQTVPSMGSGGIWYKYAPCPACHGHGTKDGKPCPICNGSLIDIGKMGEDVYDIHINEKEYQENDVGLVIVGGEELLPGEKTVEWVHANKHLGAVFATEEEAYPYIEPYLKRLDDETIEGLHSSPELNPATTGCYVTRIRGKQTARRQEYELLSAEALSTLAFMCTGVYPREQLDDIWEKYLFTAFHDCITSTYVDAVYDELVEKWTDIDNKLAEIRTNAIDTLKTSADGSCISVFNSTGIHASGFILLEHRHTICLVDAEGNQIMPLETQQCDGMLLHRFWIKNIPPYSSLTYTLRDTVIDVAYSENIIEYNEQSITHSNVLQESNHQERIICDSPENVHKIENSRFCIEADQYGLIRVFDKLLNRTISEAGEFRPGEYILEHDEGSPWATLSCDNTRVFLAPYTRLISVDKQAGYQRMTFEVFDREDNISFAIRGFHIIWSVTLYEGVERIDFTSHIDWDDYSHRIRIAFPCPDSGKAYYEIPYGVIQRGDSGKSFTWAGYNGDWPAHNWAGIECKNFSTVLMNRGTPSYTVEKGENGDVMLLTVLRSPCMPTFLHEPMNYTMTKWDGMRDTGEHSFSYALCAYDTSIANSSAVIDAEAYNSPFVVTSGRMNVPKAPVIVSDCAYATSLKIAEQEDALILRVVEYRGKGGSVAIYVPENYPAVYCTNMLENTDLPVEGRKIEIKPFEIITLKFKTI